MVASSLFLCLRMWSPFQTHGEKRIATSSLNQLPARRRGLAVFVETSGFQPWLFFRITWKLLKISCPHPHPPTPCQIRTTGHGPQTSVFRKRPRWSQCEAKVEKHNSRLWGYNPKDWSQIYHPKSRQCRGGEMGETLQQYWDFQEGCTQVWWHTPEKKLGDLPDMVFTSVNSSNDSLYDHNPYDRTVTGTKERVTCMTLACSRCLLTTFWSH